MVVGFVRQDLLDLLVGAMKVIPTSDFEVSVPGLGGDTFKDKVGFQLMCSWLAAASKAGATIAYAQQKIAGPPADLLDKEEGWRAEVLAITAVLKDAVAATLVPLLGPAAQIMKTQPWAPNISELSAWFAGLGDTLPQWGEFLADVAIARMSTLAGELQKVTPVYAHYITDTSVKDAMVKRSLLDSKVRGPLAKTTIALHKAMALATSVRAEWGVSPDAKRGEAADPEYECARLAFEAGKAALSVIAACSVVFEMSPNRVAEAEALTRVARPEIPKALWALVVKVSDKVVAAKKDGAATKAQPVKPAPLEE